MIRVLPVRATAVVGNAKPLEPQHARARTRQFRARGTDAADSQHNGVVSAHNGMLLDTIFRSIASASSLGSSHGMPLGTGGVIIGTGARCA